MSRLLCLCACLFVYSVDVLADVPTPASGTRHSALAAPKPAPAARFFPITPSAHMRPAMRSPRAIHRNPAAAPEKPAKPAAGAVMTEEQARQILSIYQVQN